MAAARWGVVREASDIVRIVTCLPRGKVAATARECGVCGNISDDELCPICADPRRSTGVLCVVEDVSDLWAMERAGGFRGRYHVLGGTLSALDSVGPEALRIPALAARVIELAEGRGLVARCGGALAVLRTGGNCADAARELKGEA